jgi:hypothetical protein
MTFKEKMAWVNGLVTFAVAVVYFTVVGRRLDGTAASDVAYQWPLIIAIIVSVASTIVGTIVVSIGTAIKAEITGEGSVKDIDRSDERDTGIDRRGELVGYYVSSAGVLLALVLAMLRQDQFWIANGLYLFMLIGSIASSVAKIVLYRRGF